MASAVNFEAAFTGLQKGVESARMAGAQIAKHSHAIQASTESSPEEREDGKGSIIDVTA